MSKFGLIFGVFMATIFSGCSWFQNPFSGETAPVKQEVVIQKIDKDDIRDVMKREKLFFDNQAIDAEFVVTGEGIPPMNTVSPAQAMVLAKRAAMVDGYRQLAGKLYGVKITAKDTVRDAMLKDSTIEARVDGLVKNAGILEQDFKDGSYRVKMVLKMDQDKWKELFAY